ncbi:MAG: potassium/proton antiporter [Candidatus Nanopelagicales bacterium]
MSLEQLAVTLLVGAAIVLAAVVGVRLADRLGVPGLLLYLGLGILIGETVPALDLTDAELATVLGYAALVVILAEGGLTTRVSELRPVLWPSLVLATVGVGASIAAVAVPLVLLLGLDWRSALLLGAVLAATDAAAVFSVLRRLHLAPRLKGLLEAEAGFNDAPVVVLVALISSGSFGESPWWTVPLLVVGEIAGGAVVGVLVGFAGRWLMPRLALPSVGLYPIAAMALIVGAYGVADLVHASGFMAVYVSAVIIGSSQVPHRRSVVGFAEALAWTAQIGLFVMLGLLADLGRLPSAVGVAAVAGAALIVLGRPLAAVVSLVPFRWPGRWVAFVSWAGLRGAVPIVFAAIPLGAAVPGAERVFDATLLLVLVLTVLQTPTLPWFARRLGVAQAAEPDELEVESAPLDGVNATVLGIDVPAGSKLVGVYVEELGLPHGAVVSLVVRGDEVVVPSTTTRLRAGDRMVVVAAAGAREQAERRLRAVSRRGRLAGWLGDRGAPD